jgi:hypothetical protein
VAQGYPPRRSDRMPAGGRGGSADEPTGRHGRREAPRADAFDDSEEGPPPWAGPGIHPAGPGGRPIRPPRDRDRGGQDRGGRPAPATEDRAWQPDEDEDWPPPERRSGRGGRRAATRARRSRHRLLLVGGLAVIVLAVLGLWATNTWPFQVSAPAPATSGLVTTYQHGELRTVPNACGAISATLLGQYLPGKVAQVSQSADNASQSQCTWTLDAKPDFRVLTVSSQAYAPSLLAAGDGSATFSAIDAYGQLMQGLSNPPKASKLPKGQMGTAVGLGPDAFTALQVFHGGGVVTDEVTVVVRDRNVIIEVTMQGQEHGGGFGPVPDATLRAAALAAAHEVLAGIR